MGRARGADDQTRDSGLPIVPLRRVPGSDRGVDARGPVAAPENYLAMPFVWNGMMVATRPIAGGFVPKPRSGIALGAAAETRFMGLAERELDRLFRLAGLILGNASEAEDAVGDALLRGWRSAGSLRSEADFPAWLDRILVNVCRDRLRRRSRIRSFR